MKNASITSCFFRKGYAYIIKIAQDHAVALRKSPFHTIYYSYIAVITMYYQ